MKALKVLTIVGVFVLALGVGTVSEAAGAKVTELNTHDGAAVGNLGLGGDRAVLYSQVANVASGYSFYADDTNGDSYACEGADDFSVTWAEGWLVDQVHLVGIYVDWDGDPTDTAQGAHLTFYADGGTTPGASVCSTEASVNSDMIPAPPATGGYGTHGDILFDLDTPCNLPMGDYWLGMSVIMDYAGYAVDFRWTLQNGITGDEPAWQNPGDGFGSGCTSWCTFTELFGSNANDNSFEILGDEITGDTPTPNPGAGGAPIPTMNAYGIFAMVALLLGVAVLVFIRRR